MFYDVFLLLSLEQFLESFVFFSPVKFDLRFLKKIRLNWECCDFNFYSKSCWTLTPHQKFWHQDIQRSFFVCFLSTCLDIFLTQPRPPKSLPAQVLCRMSTPCKVDQWLVYLQCPPKKLLDEVCPSRVSTYRYCTSLYEAAIAKLNAKLNPHATGQRSCRQGKK